MKKLTRFLFNKISLTLIISALSISAISETYQLGDLAPRGNPDGQLNAADALLLQRIIIGDIVPMGDEALIGDVAPLGNPDQELNAGDLAVQKRAILGLINLGTVSTSSITLNTAQSPTTDNPYSISGTANANTSIDIYVQGILQHQITSDSNGDFSVDVYLFDGMNEIYAAETDGAETSAPSNTLQVQYDNNIARLQSGIIDVDTVWTPGSTQQPYIISSTLTVAAGVEFVIQPGTELKFDSGSTLSVNGDLVIAGEAQNRAVFTSNLANPSPNDWSGISISDGGVATIDHADIQYANEAVYFRAGSAGTVTNSLLTNNRYGIHSEGSTNDVSKNPMPVVTNNSIYGNTVYNYATRFYADSENVVLNANNNWWGSVDASVIVGANGIYDYQDQQYDKPLVDIRTILDAENGNVYSHKILHGRLVDNNTSLSGLYTLGGILSVDPGQTLTIEAGNRIESGSGGTILVKGELIVAGTALDPAVFTSVNVTPAANDWSGISISDGGVATIDYAYIKYAREAIKFNTGSAGTVTNSLLTNNRFGIYVDNNANPVITFNTIVDNEYGIYLYGYSTDPNPTISSNDIFDNSIANLYLQYIEASTVLNVTNNWWGTDVLSDIRATIKGSTPLSSVLLDSIALTPNTSPVPVSVVTSEEYISPIISTGIQDDVNLIASFSQAVNWTVNIENTNNLVVKSYTDSTASININWDGKSDSFANVSDGEYSFVIGIDGVTRYIKKIIVDNTVPLAEIDTSLNNITVSELSLVILGNAYDRNLNTYTLEVADGFTPVAADYRQIVTSQSNVSNSELFNWPFGDGTNVLSETTGDKTLKLTVVDSAGNTSFSTIQLTLNHVSISNVSHSPYSFSPSN